MVDNILWLDDEEYLLANAKIQKHNKLSFAVMLKFFQLEKHYPSDLKYIDIELINTLANQLDLSPNLIEQFDWNSRSAERFKSEIRSHFGYKKASLEDVLPFKEWLRSEVFPKHTKRIERIEHAYSYFHENKIEPFSKKELQKYISTAHHQFEQDLFHSINNSLANETKSLMDEFFVKEDDSQDEENNNSDDGTIRFRHLKYDIPGAKLKHVERAINKVDCLRELKLPTELLESVGGRLIKKYYTRVMAETPSHMSEYAEHAKYAIFTMFCYFRSQSLIDSSADLLIQLIHKLQTKSEKFVDKKILSEVKCVNGKFDILYQLSLASASNPSGVIKDTIYPEVTQETLFDLVNELYHRKGRWYESQVQIKMHSLYSHSHRRCLLVLLDSFAFRTNIKDSQPLLDAINVIKMHKEHNGTYYPDNIDVPLENVFDKAWLETVVTKGTEDHSKVKINKMNYELAVLQELKKQLNCKMIWIVGAYRFRDPERDLPKDFESNRKNYYDMLDLPMNVEEFITSSKDKLHESLTQLNNSITESEQVEILSKNNGHIKISPYEPQDEPVNIKKLHQTIKEEYGSINLIDALKESELQIEFLEWLETIAKKEGLPKNILRLRLLLCIYAIGTNTGLKPISSANRKVTHNNLRYAKRRFITVDSIRQAIVKIINQTLSIRDPRIWGEATTGVACDSKKLNVWDQNLMAEWHTRYKGRGVMVYWHVEKNALCIYSQLKTCSSSEVGSMLKGILQHCTDMEVNEAYVDTHGQSTLGFGVSELLGFDLLPRLKNIHKQKLFYPSSDHKQNYDNLTPILKEPIKWQLIRDYYDDAIKYIVALKTGSIEPDVFVKRFSRDNYKHPVYKAIIEIGKVAKTNFLCRYLMSEKLRIEIHDSQNVVERLNSIMGFIFFGKQGEISTNNKNEQELGIVCLHLLQACMGYINTLIFQEVLSRQEWKNKLTKEDKRALNLLFHSHINPYGLFPLDLEQRLDVSNRVETINNTDANIQENFKQGNLEEIV